MTRQSPPAAKPAFLCCKKTGKQKKGRMALFLMQTLQMRPCVVKAALSELPSAIDYEKFVTSAMILRANSPKIPHMIGETSFTLPVKTLMMTQVIIANMMPVAIE